MHAFRTAPATDDIPYAPQSSAEGVNINTAGDVLGEYLDFTGHDDAFVAYHDGTIATVSASKNLGFGFTGITDKAQIVYNANQLNVWQNGTTSVLANCGQCVPIGLNNALQVVGFIDLQDSRQTAFLYSNGSVYDLNGLIPSGTGWVLQSAGAINDQGQIIGFGSLNGAQHSFRLDPVPTMTGGPISLVQSASVSGSAVPSVSVAFPSGNTKGNLIVAFVRSRL